MAHGSWLKAHGSCLKAWLKAHGRNEIGARARAWGTQRQLLLGHEPDASPPIASRLPGAEHGARAGP